MTEDFYKVCQYCKHFDGKNQICTNECAFGAADDFNFSKFYEEGTLSEAIGEGFHEFQFRQSKIALSESSLSRKKQEEILRIFSEELEDAFINWTETIDDSVSTALNNFDFGSGGSGIYINNPSEMFCKYYL